jgi:6-hydroxynicotinate reductase
VPTPAIVAPIEFTMRLADYAALGGHVDSVIPLTDVLERASKRVIRQDTNPWPIGGKALLG